jgi:hypothetical protein
MVWATYGTTESGDDLGVAIWYHCPTANEVDEYYRSYWPEEYESVGYVRWKLTVPESML